MRSGPAQFFFGKMPQTPQWSLGQNSTACQLFQILTSLDLASMRGKKLVFRPISTEKKAQIFLALEAWSNDVQM